VDYQLIDADNHYYEAEDAFTRHGDEGVKRFVRWLSEGKRRHIMFGTKLSTSLPNPTFDPIAKPGIFMSRLKELAAGGTRNVPLESKERYGELEPLPDAYRVREARLDVMDEQGLERCLLFPTLGVGIEGLVADDVDMAYRVFHAFNRWLEDDWGFGADGRLYGVPYIPMLDPGRAAAELDDVLDRGARMVAVRPGPANGRSPADPVWDPFWSRVDDAAVPVAYHAYAGPDAYDDAFRLLWARQTPTDPRYQGLLRAALGTGRAIHDTLVALVLGNLFGRHPNVRVASIENGAAWVPYCLHVLDHAGGIFDRYIEAFGEVVSDRPSDVFKRHVWVSPFAEEDVRGLAAVVGPERVLFGSDWPHAEGTVTPKAYIESLDGMDDGDRRLILRDNALGLLAAG
jgi:predicted TIM-barrel fold metal-dependent hydrolase